MKIKKIFLWLFLLVVLIVLTILFMRLILPKQVDDVNPQILCSVNLMDESKVLMVIPIFNNISIADNKEWCNYILSLNKTLGMHGVYHSYQEFLDSRDEFYVRKGMEEFKRCFGYYPEIFEAPQIALSRENANTLNKMNLRIINSFYQITHKVYHCSDTGKYSNRFMDWF